MKRVLFIILGIVILLVAAAAIVPFLIPKDVYKERIEIAATNAFGREVMLNGDVDLSVFPRISATIEDVTVANGEGFSAEHMIEASELRASVRWLPLLSKRVEIAEIAFVDANVSLERLIDGRANWILEAQESASQEGAESSGSGFEATVERARLVNTSLDYSDVLTGQSFSLKDFTFAASMQALSQPLTAKGSGVFEDQRFNFDIDLVSPEAMLSGTGSSLEFDFSSELADFDYKGVVTLGETPALDGQFSTKVPSLAALIEFALTNEMDLAPLGSIEATGNVAGPMNALKLNLDAMHQKSDLLEIDYIGTVDLAGAPIFNGTLEMDSPDMGLLMTKLGVSNPSNEALEKVAFTGTLDGPLYDLAITDMQASHTSSLLKAEYTGAMTLGQNSALNGHIEASSTKMRELLSAAKIELAPGETLQSFNLSSDTGGSLSALVLNNLEFKLDDLNATGNATMKTGGIRPFLTADLAMPSVDLTPFMGPPPEGPGWSTEPLALEGLKALDADLALKAGSMTMNNITMSDAELAVTLRSGKLDTQMNTFKAFGGLWHGTLGLDASKATPTLTIDMTGDSILMSDIVSTFTGSDKLTGTGAFRFQANSSGLTLDSMVKALDGQMSTNLADGAIRGVDFAQLRHSLADAEGSLASGNFTLILSPGAKTDFSTFTSLLSIHNGVATVEDLSFLMPELGSLKGLGTIDIGGQSLNLSLLPEFDRDGQGDRGGLMLNGIDIPIRMSGNWLSPSFSLDTDALQTKLQADLTEQIGSEISDQLGGTAGDLLSDVLGLPDRSEEPPVEEAPVPANADENADEVTDESSDQQSTESEESEDQPEAEKSIEEEVEDLAKDALSDLFGNED